jgi:hypothetical protein
MLAVVCGSLSIPVPFDALVFMLPNGTLRQPTDGDCPFQVLSRTTKGQNLSLPIPPLDFRLTAEQDAVLRNAPDS